MDDYDKWLNDLKSNSREKFLSRGISPKSVEEFEESGELGNIQLNAGKDKQRLICKKCSNPFLVEINGNKALFNSQNDSSVVIVEFKELIGICKSCVATYGPKEAHTILRAKDGLQKYERNYGKLLPYVELLNYPVEYALAYTYENSKPELEETLEGKYGDAQATLSEKDISNYQTIFNWLKKLLFS